LLSNVNIAGDSFSCYYDLPGTYKISTYAKKAGIEVYAETFVTVNPAAASLDCTIPTEWGGGTLPNGDTIKAFNARTGCTGDCVFIIRKCENGILSGDSSYKYKNCTELYSKTDGKCGSAAGETSSVAPTTGLCDAGSPGPLSSSGSVWSWLCLSICGGETKSCSTGSGSPTGTSSPGGKWIEVPVN
jgi:hypothetical protein